MGNTDTLHPNSCFCSFSIPTSENKIFVTSLYTVNRKIFVLKNVHAIIFRVKIFSYASRPYENILTTKIFQ